MNLNLNLALTPRSDDEAFNPEFLVVERVIGMQSMADDIPPSYLVKWWGVRAQCGRGSRRWCAGLGPPRLVEQLGGAGSWLVSPPRCIHTSM